MLRSYFKLACRNLLKNKLTSFINIVGLSAAIGCSIVFFLLLDLEYTSDRFHENAENIFMVGYTLEGDQQRQRWGDSPLPLGPALEADFPQIKRAVRVADRRGTMRYKDRVFSESIRFVDPAFLDMFSFPLQLGDKDVLSDKGAIVISKEIAEKYLGTNNPVGEQVVITFNKQNKETFIIKGVAEEFPLQASFSFNILASFDKLRDIDSMHFDDWGALTRATFIQIDDANEISSLAAQMDGYVQHQNAARLDRPIASLNFEPLPTLSWESQEIKNSISSGSTPQVLIMLFIIGLFLLLQACFNYINTALASGSGRMREIGIRKVAGSQRIQLICQFLSENLMLCLLSLIGGLLLTEFVFLPGLFEIMGEHDKISMLDFFNNMHLWMFFLVLLLLTGLGSGIYPALYVSRLQPVSILKGKQKMGRKNFFTHVLLSLQFGIAFLIICLVITFWQNNQYQRERDWGYAQEHVINIKLESSDQYEVLNNAIAQNPNVLQTAGTFHSIGQSRQQAVVEIDAEKHEVVRFDVGFNYLKTLGIRLKNGRFFITELSTDSDAALVVNEKFVREADWQQVTNKVVRYENKIYKVVGVVEDFHYASFFYEIEPVMIRIVPPETFRQLSVRVNAGAGVKSQDVFREAWQRFFPDSPYVASFQDSVFDQAFHNSETLTNIFVATAAMALIISCMGLLGLVTLLISMRMKEFSIHKVLGASAFQITSLITKRYIILLALSTLLALPTGYFFLQGLLDGVYHQYHITLGPSPFIWAASVIVLTALLTIASQVIKAAVRNPIDALRYE